MEDIKRRLEFSNPVVQLQAVEKLYESVRKTASTEKPLVSSLPETVEGQLLWQCTGSQELGIAQHASSRLVQLVQEGVAEFSYVLNGFLNQIPAAKNVSGIVPSLGELLVMQYMLKTSLAEPYMCPYKIRNPPHPFITIVTNRPSDSWPHLVEYVTRLFSDNRNSVPEGIFQMFDPFFKFIMLDPKHQPDFSRLRQSLPRVLVIGVQDMVDGPAKKQGFQYLMGILKHVQMASSDEVMECCYLCADLLHLYGNRMDDLDLEQGQEVVSQALKLCLTCQGLGLDFFSLLQALTSLCNKHPKVAHCDLNCGILGELMLQARPGDNMQLISLVKTILYSGQDSLPLVCSGFLSLAVINILALPSTVVNTSSQKLMMSSASELIQLIEKHTSMAMMVKGKNSTGTNISNVWVRMAQKLAYTDASVLKIWLHRLQSHIKIMSNVPVGLVNLLVWTLVSYSDTETCRLAVQGLSAVASREPAKSLLVLPVMLYALGKSTCPTLQHHILLALPKLAFNKYNVPPILKTILGLGESPKLKSLSIRLLTELWTVQDRCFPTLLKVVMDTRQGSVTMATLIDDVTLAKAHAIREVCKLRPEQHGADMLGPISQMLDWCTEEGSAPAAALVLEALYHICEAEVIDIVSTWQVLEEQLTREKRGVVVEKICGLMSLVPRLQVNTEQFQVFISEMTRRLWLYTRSDNVGVVKAAYSALAHYSREHFHLSHFQYQVVEEFVVQAQAMLEQEISSGVTTGSIDTVMPEVPGVCYIRQLQQLTNASSPGYNDLLSSLVAEEVASLPRGIYFTSLRQPGALANQNKALAGIPTFIQAQYEKTKQLGLRPSLAAALLLCYDPPVEVGRDGRPRKHYRMSHGKNFEAMFTSLLQDVQVQPADWHRTLGLPQAWAGFTERLFASMVQARRTEVEAQLSRDFIDVKESEEKTAAAWLWARDAIVDNIKKATKGNPTIQWNAVLALSGLATATQRYVTSLDREELKRTNQITEHISHSHWLMLVLDSLMSLVDFTFTPKAGMLGLCQQRAADDRLPASVLAQASGVLALCQLTPIIMANYSELVYTLLEHLTGRLPGQQGDEEFPPVLQLIHGYGIGLLLSRLVQENFPDVAGSKGAIAVMTSLDKLEESCFSDVEHRAGAMLGVREVLCSLCQEGKTDSRVHVVATLRKLQANLKGLDPSHAMFQPVCVVLSSVTGSAFITNTVDIETADTTCMLLQNLVQNNPESAGASLGLGTLCYSLQVGGHPTVDQTKASLQSDWLKTIGAAGTSPLRKLAAVNGLLASVGLEKGSLNVDLSSTESKMQTDPFIKGAFDLLTLSDTSAPGDLISLQATTVWLLGNLYMSSSAVSFSSNTAPSNYSYLPEASVLRATIDFLIVAGKQGPEKVSPSDVEVCLKSLQEKITGILPPLNWMAVLSPLIKLPFGDTVKELVVKLGVLASPSSTMAALFVASWIVPPLFATLPVGCQNHLLVSADSYVKTVTPSVLKTFLEKSCLPAVQESMLQLPALKGLNSALKVPDPPESVIAMLYQAVAKTFGVLKTETNPSVLNCLSLCVSQLPDSQIDTLTSGDCVCGASLRRGAHVRAFLVSHAHQPIAILNSCVDATFDIDCDRGAVLALLAHCFHAVSQLEGAKSRLLNQVTWLLELMGHSYNMSAQTYQMSDRIADKSRVVSFAVNVFAAAVCTWTERSTGAKLGLTSDLFDHFDLSDDVIKPSSDLSDFTMPLDCLPHCIVNLRKEPWVQILPKVIDWLMNMMEVREEMLTSAVKFKLKDCLSSLRHSEDFQKIAVWTKAVQYAD
ncbi:focadhesin-like [Mya arenaria]|uniref:focadhesin-like n=1 Tax=Mya arenaria TaxID=6604 RepID=UPI0022E5E81E|nr:focadhesin-like [Mya arenaria]